MNEGKVSMTWGGRRISLEGKASIRNLKDPRMQKERKILIALQGPRSRQMLSQAAGKDGVRLSRMRKFEIGGFSIDGIECFVSRTGYTGEEFGYEIFVHPAKAAAVWKLLVGLGAKPAGLGARDSTRTEAGLPLWGNELAGPDSINPIETGYGGFVKLHKPFFIGRRVLMEKGYDTGKEVVRFRMNEKGVRVPKTGDPVVNKRGKYVGAVTSCAIDSQGYLLGLAYVDKRYNREGEQIGIFSLPEKVPPGKTMDELTPGDQVLLHDEATVLTRFPTPEDKETWRGKSARVTTFMDLAQTE